MSGSPTVISTFAGCGGSSLGYRMAGFRELMAVDCDRHSCETLRLNFPDTEVLEADIAELKGEALEYWKKLKPGCRFMDVHPKGHWWNKAKCHPNRPCKTVTKTIGLYHWLEPRTLTIPEVMRACSFPDDFRMEGSFDKRWARLGNAVMPVFMKEVAAKVAETIA